MTRSIGATRPAVTDSGGTSPYRAPRKEGDRTHSHDTHHVDREVIVGSGAPFGTGLVLALAALLVLVIIAFALLWSRPWDNGGSSNSSPNVPGISDNSGGGGDTGGDTGGGDNSGGSQSGQ